MKQHPIGIIDSGVGGLSIWQEIVKVLPYETTIYVADTKRIPYGACSEEDIYLFSKRLIQYLVDQQVKLVVIACNTITVAALERLRLDFPNLPIIGTVPVVKTAAGVSKNKRIGILSTQRTAESAYQKKLIEQFASNCTVINKGTNTLVPLIEEGKIDQTILQQALQSFIDEDVDTVVLGCTHFPFLQEQMQEILGKDVQILDSSEAIARQVHRVLEKEDLLSQSAKAADKLYTTGNVEQFRLRIAELVDKQLHGRIREDSITL